MVTDIISEFFSVIEKLLLLIVGLSAPLLLVMEIYSFIKEKIQKKKSAKIKIVSTIYTDASGYEFVMNDYTKLLEKGKNSIVVNRCISDSWYVYYNSVMNYLNNKKSVVVVGTGLFPVNIELLKAANENKILMVYNPSYKEIQSLEEDKHYFIFFSDDYDTEDFEATLEYGTMASEKLLENGEEVLFLIDEVHKIYDCYDIEDIYESVFKDALASDATVICTSDDIKENDINKKLLKHFNYIVRMNDHGIEYPVPDIKYIADCALDDKADAFIEKIDEFEKVENELTISNGKLYDMDNLECNIFSNGGYEW